ncbi:MAG: cation transporter [Stygiobacter sp. RIFOXYC12_FULL_38_8]|jgi:multidrug efflux pump subunit AcrB|nr:MAG: cation transporter [Stygiobacter sp. RIFOXYA12_FULL_38_9]OGV06851.1 MAG: cation transporter [Stygiobacter sp. RIFOXYB2_FULL_37_11]OGV11902.1 MAG: cation transporter [Stygiobacter sp. RIFOXYA2_FULL_38_8]OGV13310.1 MAG: cation transporter [Stygiobacter sp. RIFOXYC2_FULL_38_25]OGV30263.1 MAG: cation transporter [Stygiobacter sp. RIFOXYC12_FULL_38_8]OGV83356.1 MAG: cation transporter [Stygiobacter sp. GWF2_38_21]
MKTKRTLIEVILRYKQPIIISTVLLVLFGIVALTQMPRDEFPEFKIRQGLIIGIFPGASSQQVEEQLTKKVENYLFQYEAVDKKKTHSISKENVMVIYVELQKKENDPKAFWAKLQHGLNEFKGQLPSGVMSLTTNDDFGNTSAILLAVESETKTYRELEKYIEKFEDAVRKIPSTSRVKHYGLQKEEINVYIDDAKLTNYGIKPLMVFVALKPQGTVNYAGDIDDGKFIRPIHIPSGYKTESDIANQIIYSDPTGNVIRVKDVAKVVREDAEPDSYIRLNGKKCLIVSLEMLPGNNIVQYGDDVKKEIEKFTTEVPSDVHVGLISDMPEFVSKSIYNFLKEFGMAIFAVILVTILLLPRRVALVAAATIPISIFITLGIMWATGMDLQTVSLAGLIIVLGMVVDNAIVIIDNYVEKLDNNITPHDAASQSVTDLFGSVFSATLIIIFSFVPMVMFLTGTAGDFVKSLPLTITYALSISLLVSVLLVPLMSYIFIKHGIKGVNSKGKKAAFLNWVQSFYDRILEGSFRKKKIVVIIGALSFLLGLLLLLITPQQSFPPFERNQFAVEVFLPVGSSLQQTDLVMREIEDKLKNDVRVKEVGAFVGTSSPRFNTLYAPNFPAKHYGQLLVITKSTEATKEILDEYSKKYSDSNPKAYIKWKQLEMSLFTSPIEIRISGDSITTIKQVAAQVSNIVRGIEGAQWVRTDYEQPLQAVKLNLKQDEASRLGYSKQILDYSLMVGTKGFPVSTIWEGDYPVNVNLKVDKKIKTNIDDIMNQYVTSPFLVSSVQVRQLADLEPEWTEGEIARRNGIRTITVRVDVERDLYAAGIFNKAKTLIDNLKLPKGVSIGYGGEYEMGEETLTPLYYAMTVTVAIIFIILLFQFRNIKTSLLIMMTLPLSIFGAALGVLITGYPFGVTALIGIISLMGIVVRNGIIYISYAETLRHEHGHTLEEAAISSGKRRMRPIFLTSAAAAVGVIPMILSRSPLWGPLGAVICFGLIFGMILSLIVLPVLYYLFHRKDFEKIEESELV